MLIALLMDLVYGLFYILTSLIDIPDLPPSIENVLVTAFDYIRSGYDILANFFDLNYLFILFAIVLAVDAGIHIYHFIMFIIKKIPFFSVE